jgi:hypothetical protein
LALRAARDEGTAEQRPPKAERPSFDGHGVEEGGKRRKKRWSDDELVAALVEAFDLIPPRVRLTQENYRRHCAHWPGFPTASAFTRRGRAGFASYRASARAERQTLALSGKAA